MRRREFIGASGAALMTLLSSSGMGPVSEAFAASRRSNSFADEKYRSAREEVLKTLENERFFTDLSNTRDNARLLYFLTRLSQAERVLELGTYKGYSSIWMALALEEMRGGKLTTVEIDNTRVLAARQNFKTCGLSKIVTCEKGDAHVFINTLKKDFDLIFLDADKDRNENYFKKLWPLLRKGGFICTSGVVRFRHMFKPFFETLQKQEGAFTLFLRSEMITGLEETVEAPSDGMAITWKKYG